MVDLGVRGNNMALLTEKQIKEIITLIALNQSTSKDLYDELCEWNEKQTAQFEPDWSKAPEGTDSVIIKSYWVNDGIWTFGENVTKYDRPPAPIITPHPHAALIAKFAEVAARRVDPWREFEYKNSISGNWEKTISTISFFHDAEYRYIGDDK